MRLLGVLLQGRGCAVSGEGGSGTHTKKTFFSFFLSGNARRHDRTHAGPSPNASECEPILGSRAAPRFFKGLSHIHDLERDSCPTANPQYAGAYS